MFGDCKGLTKVVINSNVTSIGVSAFANCTNLTEIDIPNKVTSIGNYAFANCAKISKLTLSSNITSIGESTFAGCGGDITINCNIPNRNSTSGYFYGARFKSVFIGYTVNSIGDRAFYGSQLGSIDLPSSITSIGREAFYNCSVNSITIPSSVRSIGYYAFYNSNIPIIYCKPAVPPALSGYSYYTQGFDSTTKVYVPMASVVEYKSKWNTSSSNIIGYNF